MKYVPLLLLVIFSVSCQTQNDKTPGVGSIDAIVNELPRLVTIEKGEKIDTAAIRNLFYPSAQLTILNPSDSAYAESVSLDDFLELLTDPYYEEGYLEKEIHKVVDDYNGIAQVFQTFYGKDSEGSEGRGINSYQLAYYNDRWWIISLLWTLETDDAPIPTKYGG